jgi:TolB protein
MAGSSATALWVGAVTLSIVTVSPALAQRGGQAGQCNDQWPAWAPDGRGIVFVSTRTGDPEVYTMRFGEPSPVRLTQTPGRDAHPSYSPDGKRIAFQSPREGQHTNLYLMNADGSRQERITNHAGFAGVPVWSPDGTTLAYQWRPEGEGARWRLMMVSLSGERTPRPITDGAANDQVMNWSPDGKRLVFYSDRTGINQLYVMNRDGSGVARLTTTPAEDRTAAFSPDGGTMAFMSERDGTPAGIYLMRADGSGIRRLGDIKPGHGVPFFSPDGTRVLATVTDGSGASIWAVRISDGTAERLSACRPQSPPNGQISRGNS